MAATLNSAGIVYSDGTLAYSTAAGGVGSYALMYLVYGSGVTYGPGTGLAGSWLLYSSAAPGPGGGVPAGSWRVMGAISGGNTGSAAGISVLCRYA